MYKLDKVASNQNKELNVETLCFLKVDLLWDFKGKRSNVRGCHTCLNTIVELKVGTLNFFRGKC
jgi:hypothetical protein